MKQIKQLQDEDLKDFNAAYERPKKRKVHFMFLSSNPADPITVPVCGSLESTERSVSRIRRVTCTKCLDLLENILEKDTHEEALSLLEEEVDFPKPFDPEALIETFAGNPTIRAKEHMKRAEILSERELIRPEDTPKNIVGTKKGTYYANLVELGFIHGLDAPEELQGEPKEETLELIRNRKAEIADLDNQPVRVRIRQ